MSLIIKSNFNPSGSVNISGNAEIGEILSAYNTLDDADGLGEVTYQWRRDGFAIQNANNSNYTLTASDLGCYISVTASYIDGKGTPEQVSSDSSFYIGTLGNSTSNLILSTKNTDSINGLDGSDTVIYDGSIFNYQILFEDSENVLVKDINNALNKDILKWIESLQFDDYTLTLDTKLVINTPIQVNDIITSDLQWRPDLNALSTSGFAVTWQSYLSDGSYYSVRSKLYDSDLTPLLNEFRVNSYTSYDQWFPSISPTESDNYFIFWSGKGTDDSYGIYGKLLDLDGNTVLDDFLVNTKTLGEQHNPEAAKLSSGNTVVAWTAAFTNGSDGVYFQIISSTGDFIGTERKADTNTEIISENASVIPLENNEFIVLWESRTNSYNTDIYGRIYDAYGEPKAEEFLIHEYTNNVQTNVSATTLINGSIVLCWDSLNQDELGDYGVFAKIITPDGMDVGSEFQVNTFTQNGQLNPTVAATSDGGFIVIWQGAGSLDAVNNNIYAQRFDSTGTMIGTEFSINEYSGYNQFEPNAITLSDGSIAVTWTSYNSITSYDVMATVLEFTVDAIPLSFDLNANEDEESLIEATLQSIDDSALEFQLVSNPNHGEVNLNIDGSFSYKPDLNFSGDDSFTYKTYDGINYSNTATVSLHISPINDLPSGDLFISGDAIVGNTLTLNSTIADADGLGEVTYQWNRDGSPIGEAKEATYSPTQDDVGALLTVTASYTDGYGTNEVVTSSATDQVAPNIPLVYSWNTHQYLPNVSKKSDDTLLIALNEHETGRVISAADALSALKIAVGLNPNSTADVSPYQFIAADVNQDGRVSAADALSILKMAVGLDGAPTREWILTNETTDFYDEVNERYTINRTNIDWSTISSDVLNRDVTDGLTAVLKGDVNGSWEGDASLDSLSDDYFVTLETAGIAPAEQWWVI